MFREIFLSAGIAGLLAALILTLLQMVWVTPLILQAESFEDAAAAPATFAERADAHEHHDSAHGHTHGDDQHSTAHAAMLSATTLAVTTEHQHDADAWKPADGAQRTLFTLTSNIVLGVGYALLLIGVYTLWQRPRSALQGLWFGLAGFAVFFAAPGLGLPPELPGTEAAALASRQLWWIGTVLATAVGLALLVVKTSFLTQEKWLLRTAGVLVLALPHLIGAPHLATETTLAPVELQQHFRLATAVCNAVFWLLLGALSTLALQKFSTSPSEN